MRKIIFLVQILVLTSCVKFGEYYAGMNLQPDIDRNDFQPGLNVFGILKTGPSMDTLNHYFEVQQILYIQDPLDSMLVKDANVSIYNADNDVFYQIPHKEKGIYLNESIETKPGETWEFSCQKDSFLVSASCTIPHTPEIIENSLQVQTHQFTFEIEKNETAYLYEAFLLNKKGVAWARIVANIKSKTQITMSTDFEIEAGDLLFVYAYDQNLEQYITTSNIFFKPNAYRPPYSQVNGGFGVFGALSSVKLELYKSHP